MTEGLIVETVISVPMSVLAREHVKVPRSTKGAINLKTRTIIVEWGLNPVLRRAILWHEWIHWRIYEECGYDADDDDRGQHRFHVLWGMFLPFFILYTWIVYGPSYEPEYMRPFNVWRRTA